MTNCICNILGHGDPGPSATRQEKIRQKVQRFEKIREEKLRETKTIGQVTSRVQETDYRISLRRVNFRWLRGNKIGKYFGFFYYLSHMKIFINQLQGTQRLSNPTSRCLFFVATFSSYPNLFFFFFFFLKTYHNRILHFELTC